MARRSQPADPQALARTLGELVAELPAALMRPTVTEKVAGLVAIHRVLRDLGAGVGGELDCGGGLSGRARVLAYLRAQAGRIVHTDELMIVSGIGDYARRIRELRTREGWPIISGAAMRDVGDDMVRRGLHAAAPRSMAVEEYVLVEDRCDSDAPRRWELAGILRADTGALADRICEYMTHSMEKRITAEELRYLARDSGEWTDALATLVERGRIIEGYLFTETIPLGVYVAKAQ